MYLEPVYQIPVSAGHASPVPATCTRINSMREALIAIAIAIAEIEIFRSTAVLHVWFIEVYNRVPVRLLS